MAYRSPGNVAITAFWRTTSETFPTTTHQTNNLLNCDSSPSLDSADEIRSYREAQLAPQTTYNQPLEELPAKKENEAISDLIGDTVLSVLYSASITHLPHPSVESSQARSVHVQDCLSCTWGHHCIGILSSTGIVHQ